MICFSLDEWLSFFTWRVGFLMIFRPLSTEEKLTAQSQRKWLLSVLMAPTSMGWLQKVRDGSNKYWRKMLERKIQTSYRIVIRNAIQAIKNTIVRLWVVTMKMICPKWIWVDGQRGGFIGGTLKQKRKGQHTMSKKKQCPKLHFSLV